MLFLASRSILFDCKSFENNDENISKKKKKITENHVECKTVRRN